ncbi:MAG: VWA domain-containing protein, partial [Candidatus Acidiferrales bacterium]
MRRVSAVLTLFACLFSLAFLLFSAPHRAAAQNPAPAAPQKPAKLASRSNAVLVPVVVTDKRGNHIRGLTRDEFEIREDGKPQTIQSFEEITANPKPIERAANSLPYTFSNQIGDQQAKGLQIIAIDLINTPFAHQADARKALIDFLSKSAAGENLVALVVIDHAGVHLIHNFTADRAVLVSAIQKVQSRLSARDKTSLDIHMSTMDTNSEDDAEAAQLSVILAGAAASDSAPGIATMAATAAAAQAKMDLAKESQDGGLTLQCLRQVAQYFAAVPGRKSMIWASTGFRLMQNSIPGGFGRGSTPEEWQRTVQSLEDADIAVYPVDVGGFGATARAMTAGPISDTAGPSGSGNIHARSASLSSFEAGLATDPIQARHDTLRQMAELTGGQALYNSNDLEDLLRRATQDSTQYYLLAYSIGEKEKEGWRKLDVKVHHEGVQVRSRSGFFFSNAAADPESARQADEITALTSSLQFTSLPITATWGKTEPAGASRKIHFTIVIPPGAAEVDTEKENHISLDFLALATNPLGEESGKTTQRLDRKLPAAGATQIESNGITYANTLT